MRFLTLSSIELAFRPIISSDDNPIGSTTFATIMREKGDLSTDFRFGIMIDKRNSPRVCLGLTTLLSNVFRS
jgi:hypothetical protein